MNFTATVNGLNIAFSWESPPVGSGIVVSYTLYCASDGVKSFSITLNPVLQFTLEELSPSTSYMCNIFGSTNGGVGPSAFIEVQTESKTLCFDLKLVVYSFSS